MGLCLVQACLLFSAFFSGHPTAIVESPRVPQQTSAEVFACSQIRQAVLLGVDIWFSWRGGLGGCYRCPMAELDHLVYACPDVDAGASVIEDLTGVRAVAGGTHGGRGTHNCLLTFDDRTYFEIIGIDPNQPKPEGPRAFGLDDSDGPELVAYAIHPTGDESLEDVAAAIRAGGFDPGNIIDMSRLKPDGELLSWRLTIGGGSGVGNLGALPFAIDWGASPSPASSLPSMGRLASLKISHPDGAIRACLKNLNLGLELAEGPAALVATVETKKGLVDIS